MAIIRDVLTTDALEKIASFYEEEPFDLAYANLEVRTGSGSFVKKAKPMGMWESSRVWNHPTTFLAERALAYRYRVDGNIYADFDLFIRVCHDGLRVRQLNETLACFHFGGMSNQKSLREMRRRIAWRNQILRDNHCHPAAYIEGAALELAKYIKG